MSTAAARSFSRIFRCARTTSRLTMMGINLNRQFLFLLEFLRFFQQPRDKDNHQTRQQTGQQRADAFQLGSKRDDSDQAEQHVKKPVNEPPAASARQMPDRFG